MKKIIIFLVVCLLSLTNIQAQQNSRTLVAYFSATGNTHAVAQTSSAFLVQTVIVLSRSIPIPTILTT